ncbi:hypothetical protein vseg_009117 [Gypsophila vaccaria]
MREEKLQCLSCKEMYPRSEAGTCKECYEEASETEDELKREIHDLNSKIAFLTFSSDTTSFSDVVLVASHENDFDTPPLPVLAHKAVLASRSPVFKAMLESEMEESRSGTINISDVSYDALRAFVKYLYTGDACLDEQMACDLLVLAEKYQVNHLKLYCEKFLVSKLNWDNAVMSFSFAHRHNGKHLQDSALSMITDKMDDLIKSQEYAHLVEKDPRLLVEIYEANLSKKVNTAAKRDS